jgi:hypothetical protein
VKRVTERAVGPPSWALETGWAERTQAKIGGGYDAGKMSIERPEDSGISF